MDIPQSIQQPAAQTFGRVPGSEGEDASATKVLKAAVRCRRSDLLLRLRFVAAGVFRFNFTGQFSSPVRPIEIRIETHDMKIEFAGSRVLVCVVEIQFVLFSCVSDVGHIFRL